MNTEIKGGDMKKQNKLDKLFDKAKEQESLLDMSKVKVFLECFDPTSTSGQPSSNFKFNNSGLPKNSLFNLKNLIIMTSSITAISIVLLSAFPGNPDSNPANPDMIYYIDGVKAISSIIDEELQTTGVKTKIISGIKKEEISNKQPEESKAPVNTNYPADTIKVKPVPTVVLDLNNNDLLKLGFQEYNKTLRYANKINSKLSLHLNIDSAGPRGRALIMDGPDSTNTGYNLAVPIRLYNNEKSVTTKVLVDTNVRVKSDTLKKGNFTYYFVYNNVDFYPDYLTDIQGKKVVDINTAIKASVDINSVDKNVDTAVKIQTMIPILLRKQYFKTYKNYLLWFSANQNFINALPKNISIDIGKAYKMYMYNSIRINTDVSIKIKEEKPKSMYFPDAESEMPELNKFKLYPNPVSDYLNLDFETNQPVKFKMFITDISGKQIIGYNREFSFNKAGQYHERLDLNGMTPGIYIMMLYTANGSKINKRIVVQ